MPYYDTFSKSNVKYKFRGNYLSWYYFFLNERDCLEYTPTLLKTISFERFII